MKQRTLFWQIYPAFVIVTMASLLVVLVVACLSFRYFYYQNVYKVVSERLGVVEPLIAELVAKKDTAKIHKMMRSLSAHSHTQLTLTDLNGVLISDSDIKSTGVTNLREIPEVYDALHSATGKGSHQRFNMNINDDYYYAAKKIKFDDEFIGILRVGIPLKEMHRALYRIYLRVFFGGAWTALVVLVGSWLLSIRLSQPLVEIQKYANRIAAGDLSAKINVHNLNTIEVRHLGKAMNKMAVLLRRRIKNLDDQKNEQEAILSSMSEGVLAVTLDEKIQHLNLIAASILNISKSRAENRSIQEAIRIPELTEFIKTSVKSKEMMEKELRLSGDKERILNVRSSPLTNSKRRHLGTVLVFSDITQMRKLEQHRKEFVANVSHELRTPLTSIKGFAETLSNKDISEEDRVRFAQIVVRQASKLNLAIDELLALSRLEKEKGIEMKVQHLLPILRQIKDTFFIQAEKKGAYIDLNCDPKNVADINIPLFERAMTNLIDNALKYGGDKCKILIQVQQMAEELVVTVADQGPGIDPKHHERLFERFYRVEESRNSKFGGTGLGLAIVKHVAEMHGGRVQVRSELGKGSCFDFILPVSKTMQYQSNYKTSSHLMKI